MPTPFDVTCEPAPPPPADVTLVRLRGSLDAHTAPRFEQALRAARQGGAERFVIDCQALDYISSAGLGVIVETYREVTPRGGTVVVAALAPDIADIFDILGFSKIIRAHTTVAEALAALAEPPDGPASDE